MPALDRLPPANAHIRPHPPFDDNPPMSGGPQSAKIILRDQPQTRVRQAASKDRKSTLPRPANSDGPPVERAKGVTAYRPSDEQLYYVQ